ncbi:acyltransferase family protein [Pararoseomonas indoligenes]|uniref:Acyltransferase n=1 Tax=Roseomonas indoligenes TaxID=2820811 RepID=A0A940N0C5_9PROT|nr:acyltransferase [Pararoseomonas indoligenes]MBP0494447.1 acyltransferase [Pararoseomonas indoligenes]
MPARMPQLASIQYLRAVAALMVVIYHARLQTDRLDLPLWGTDPLAAGVDVFFIISGLIMWVTTAVQPVAPATFWWRRLVRVVPLYWALTGMLVTVSLVGPSLLRTARFDPAHVLASFLFLPWPHPAMGLPLPVLIPGWTLNYEMAFYFLFGLALLLPARARFWAVGAALALPVVLAHLLYPPGLVLAFYGSSLVLEFWGGMALGRLLLAGRLPGAGASALLLALGFALLPLGWAWSEALSRGVALGPPALLVVLGALGMEAAGRVPSRPLPLLLGDVSYAIYLCHVTVLAVSAEVWRRLPMPGGPAGTLIFLLAVTAASIGAGLVLYRLVELPLRRAMRGREVRLPAAQARAV